jgi:hypothetical protein
MCSGILVCCDGVQRYDNYRMSHKSVVVGSTFRLVVTSVERRTWRSNSVDVWTLQSARSCCECTHCPTHQERIATACNDITPQTILIVFVEGVKCYGRLCRHECWTYWIWVLTVMSNLYFVSSCCVNHRRKIFYSSQRYNISSSFVCWK